MLSQQVVLITGASSGVGQSTARLLSQRGYTVFGTSRNPASAESITTPAVEMNVRPGGASLIVMRSPEGQDMPNPGVILEAVPNEKLVFTDAFTKAWEPSEKPFMTAILTFEDAGDGRTKYTALARHWSVADREAHEKMGFHQGWTLCTEQLAALAGKL